MGARLEEFLNFLSWDPSLFDPSDPVESLTYRVLVSACKEASATLASTQTHSLAAHWKQQNRKYMEAHKAKRDKELGAGGEQPLDCAHLRTQVVVAGKSVSSTQENCCNIFSRSSSRTGSSWSPCWCSRYLGMRRVTHCRDQKGPSFFPKSKVDN